MSSELQSLEFLPIAPYAARRSALTALTRDPYRIMAVETGPEEKAYAFYRLNNGDFVKIETRVLSDIRIFRNRYINKTADITKEDLNGFRNGFYLKFYTNGVLASMVPFIHDYYNGIYRYYDPHGHLEYEGLYLNGIDIPRVSRCWSLSKISAPMENYV
jgi:hypothetical protein